MFVFSKVGSDNEKFILLPTKGFYTIGRLSTDLILSEDLSISRTHVRLSLSSAAWSDRALTVEDLGSKYGTYINADIESNKKMKVKTPTTLQVGDRIRVGALKNIWQLSQLKLTTTTSALENSKVLELAQVLLQLGGSVSPSWTEECTHLTMDIVTVTVKLLHALLENRSIVNVAFWREMLKVSSRKHITEGWPKPEDFRPIQSPDMPSIKWRADRTKLFAGKTFIFMNRKHIDMYGSVVEKASGIYKDLNSGVRKTFLTRKDVVVIQYVPSTQSQATETIYSVQGILEQAGLRLIPDYEIGLAILHCSIQKFCNPRHKMENSLPTTESMNSSILIPNTERTQTEKNVDKIKESEFVLSESQIAEIYPPSTESETTKPGPVAASAPKQAKPEQKKILLTRQSKRNNAIYLDSSDEEVQMEEQSKVKKPSSFECKPKQKRKIQIIVDSSDEEEHLRKKTKKSTVKAQQNSVKSPIKELVKEKPTQSSKTQAAAILPNRSTRSSQHNIMAASPRRSLRGIKSPEKVQLSGAQMDEDSEEDEGLFQFKSKTAASAERQSLQTTVTNIRSTSTTTVGISPNDKPLPKSRISVRNFLEKSQNLGASQAAAAVSPFTSQPRKRLRLEQLNESDSDDNESLFKFGGGKKVKQTRGSDEDSNDEQVFNFKPAAQKHQQKTDDVDEDFVCTEPFIPKLKSKYIVPKPIQEPRKVNISGWLSCSGLQKDAKAEAKPEQDVMQVDSGALQQEDAEDDDEKLAHQKWLATIKDCIQVRMCDLNISTRIQDETDTNTTANKYSGRKNFKKFVKKSILHPHQRILELKPMQLADGMLSEL